MQATPDTRWDPTAEQGWTRHRLGLARRTTGDMPGSASRGGAVEIRTASGERSVATASAGSIHFEYCVVEFTRAWLSDALLADPTWYLPGERRGRFSANDGAGLPALPVGFVAVRRLCITATWGGEDVARREPVQCGPFAVDPALGGDLLRCDGVQIVGWLLRELASLPPNDDEFALRGTAGDIPTSPLLALPAGGLPPPPPRRGDQPIPWVARIDAAAYRALTDRGQPTVVFVSAVWASPSRQMERVVESLARQHRDTIGFAELPFESIEGTPVVRQLGLRAVPSFFVLDRGREIARLVGMVPEALISTVDTLSSCEQATAPGRTVPLWGVPRLHLSSFEAAIRRRDMLVFFADPLNTACRALEPMTRAVSALYAPRFQTCEIDCTAEPELRRRVGDPSPGTFVFYQLGAAVARVSWPSSRPELMKRLGIV